MKKQSIQQQPSEPIPLESLNFPMRNPPVAVMLSHGLDPTKPMPEQTLNGQPADVAWKAMSGK